MPDHRARRTWRGQPRGGAPSRADGHGHGHGSLRLVPGRPVVARALAAAVGICLVATLVGVVALWPRGDAPEAPGVTPGTQFVTGTVTDISAVPCPREITDPVVRCEEASVRVTSGPTEGETVPLQVTEGLPGAPDIDDGDDLRLGYFAAAPEGLQYRFDDFQRSSPLLGLALLFAVAVVALGRVQGLRSLLGLVGSLVVIVGFLLPALLRGGPPLPLALVTAVLVALLALGLAHGVHVGTAVAFLGSVAALALTTVLGVVFVALAEVTGTADQDAVTLAVAAGDVDLRGLLLAGVVIGALGVLDDVTVTQVSAVVELRAARPDMGTLDLYRAGQRIGRDHIASTVNTLVLAYAGASLPLLLLFSQSGRSFTDVLTSEVIAVEVVRALVGGVGLIAAVPVTTGLAALVVAGSEDRWSGPGRASGREVEDAGVDRLGVDGLGVDPQGEVDFWDRR